ncbi:rubrerythrin [Caldalkalibacillus uzonensis]|uniref:Rubrerythrin n=1 Tax=Caldalkalibacillus uzonensis TaxID=353224 RepID=A0ABU0CVD1_9BACI|nr:ferritin-like domain-containing protein [Caldalkalibacillus uzonensis]MDQ0340358.1 rubrerythrin [Caldalkalibacillus uzonensis]
MNNHSPHPKYLQQYYPEEYPSFPQMHIPLNHQPGIHQQSSWNSMHMSWNAAHAPAQGLFNQILHYLLQAIHDEAQAIDFYSRLKRMAPDQLHQDFIHHALEDEQHHLQDFIQLYVDLTGQQPHYRIQPVAFQTYQEGVFKAYLAELEAYEFYRDMMLMSHDIQIRDTFFRAMTDEIEHASRFSFLYFTSAWFKREDQLQVPFQEPSQGSSPKPMPNQSEQDNT